MTSISKKNVESNIWYRIAAIVIIVFAAKNVFLRTLDWKNMQGYEAYVIAQAIARGEGYSFPSTGRWLFKPVTDGEFHPTSWVDPIYTFSLAALIWVFGEYHQLAAAIFNLLLLISLFVFTYLLAERLMSPKAAVLTIFVLALSRLVASHNFNMDNTALAASFIALSALILTSFFDRPSYRRACFIVVVLGLTVLACPSAQLLLPISIMCVVFWGRKNIKQSISQAILILIIAIAIMAPWVIRNYLTFHEFVLIRNGAGQLAFVGTVAAGATVDPNSIVSEIKTSWTAETPTAALKLARNQEKLKALWRFQMEYANEIGPTPWDDMNEAQRDKWFLSETKNFLITNPVLSTQFAIAKIKLFASIMGWLGKWLILLAGFGGLLSLKQPALFTLALWVGSYISPFLLFICHYPRYRVPIEALSTILAMFTIFWMLNRPLIRNFIAKYKQEIEKSQLFPKSS
jgi:hypothetical protein